MSKAQCVHIINYATSSQGVQYKSSDGINNQTRNAIKYLGIAVNG